MELRSPSLLDRLLAEAGRALHAISVTTPAAGEASPARGLPDAALDERERRHVAGLMRVNHVGEVCAQGLYFGQAAVARDDALRHHLLQAAAEETSHLAWCGERLEELGSRGSYLNPLWYGGAWTIGAVAGLLGDALSLGFVVETERQVEAHLDGHLDRLPDADQRSRAILERMKEDEARHADEALQAGAAPLPDPLPKLMGMAADVMRAIAYRI